MSLSLVRQATSKTCLKRSLALGSYTSSRSLLRPFNYSTAAAATKTEREHVILPNPSASEFRSTARILPSSVAEQFAILKACIMSGTMVRAERIMAELYKSKPEEMKLFADVNMYNAFLNGFVEVPHQPMTKECLSWFDSMKPYGVTADANTFAIIVKGFLK